MANVTKVVEEKVTGVKMELGLEEVKALIATLRKVGGYDDGPRLHLRSILGGLQEATGIYSNETGAETVGDYSQIQWGAYPKAADALANLTDEIEKVRAATYDAVTRHFYSDGSTRALSGAGKVDAIKEVRSRCIGLGLEEAKDAVEAELDRRRRGVSQFAYGG